MYIVDQLRVYVVYLYSVVYIYMHVLRRFELLRCYVWVCMCVMFYFGVVDFSLWPLKRKKFRNTLINKLIEEF